MTDAQLQTLKTDIAANTNTVTFGGSQVAINALPNNDDAAFAIAEWYNDLASPDYWIWRRDVPTRDVRGVIVWAEYDALSVSKQNAFSFLISNGTVDATQANVRQGIQSIFAGTQQAGNRTALTDLARRTASRAEKLFATGTGSTASPAITSLLSPLTFSDVNKARNLP